jgi:CDP-diacylglycerol--glycerol-3-phosphate 3-phosphatidyltransferase
MLARQLPNLITLARLVLAVGVFALLSRALDLPPGTDASRLVLQAAFWLWLVAALSDTLDGWLARKHGWVSAFGRIADPVVDKVLTLGTLAYLAPGDHVYGRAGDLLPVMPVWALVVLLTREFLVTALRGYVESRGLAFPAERSGKLKMVLQSVFIGVTIGAASGIAEPLRLGWLEAIVRHPWTLAGIFWAMIALTVFSGASYCVRAAGLLRGAGAASR